MYNLCFALSCRKQRAPVMLLKLPENVSKNVLVTIITTVASDKVVVVGLRITWTMYLGSVIVVLQSSDGVLVGRQYLYPLEEPQMDQ